MPRIFLAIGMIWSSFALGDVLPVERSLQHELLAPCCYRETLDHHMSEAAATMKAEIHAMAVRGQSEHEIIEHYKALYGSRILAEPEGATWWIGTLIPVLMLVLGAVVVIRFIAKRTRIAASPSDVASSPLVS